MTPRTILLPSLFLTVSACVSMDAGPATQPPVDPTAGATAGPSATAPVTPDPTPATMPPADSISQVTESAVADLAARLRADPSTIIVIRAEQVTWPDGSLGCPQPDMGYTQALVEGYRVILDHDGRVFLYHAASDARSFMCESDDPDGGYDFVPPPGIDI